MKYDVNSRKKARKYRCFFQLRQIVTHSAKALMGGWMEVSIAINTVSFYRFNEWDEDKKKIIFCVNFYSDRSKL